MKIVNMNVLSEMQMIAAAQMLTNSLPNGWATLEEALEEIEELLKPANRLLAIIDGDDVLGWGGILEPIYNGHVVELHPLVVDAHKKGSGIGRVLVEALEEEARKLGALTIFLGADDEVGGGETSLAHVDLYVDLPKKLESFEGGTHQAGFFMKLGYKIIGVMPDANGRGKPDIYFGKQLY